MRGVVLAGRDKTALCVKRLGARIGGGDKFASLKRHRKLRGFLDKLATNPATPEIWLNERAVDVGFSVVARNDNGKPRRFTPVLKHDDETGGDMIGRQRQRLRMLQLFRLRRVPFER